MNNKYTSILLTIITLILLFISTEIVRIADSIKHDYKSEINVHFNRWYDVQAFKGTQINIDETSEYNPFINKNMMDKSHLELIKEKRNNETKNSKKSTIKE